jgi:hypothetical protein
MSMTCAHRGSAASAPSREARTHRAPVKTATGTASRHLNRRTAKQGRGRNHNSQRGSLFS